MMQLYRVGPLGQADAGMLGKHTFISTFRSILGLEKFNNFLNRIKNPVEAALAGMQ